MPSEVAEAPPAEGVAAPAVEEVLLDRLLDGRLLPAEMPALEHFIRRRNEMTGPWRQCIRVAWSSDGLDFQTVADVVAMDRAAVPEVVRTADGRYWLFYVDGDLDRMRAEARAGTPRYRYRGVPGLGSLGLAVSEDGLHFEPVEEFGVQGLVRGMVVDPDVIRLPDGTWRMYVVGMPLHEYLSIARWSEDEPHEIHTAVSTDLVHWTAEGVPLRGPYADPTVLCHADGRCLMLSFGMDHATSSDGGRTFTFRGDWGPTGFAPDFLPLPDGRVRIYYNDKALGAPIRSMTSSDRKNWAADAGERLVATYGEAPSVVPAPQGGFYMYFHTFRDEADLPPTEVDQGGQSAERAYTPTKRNY